MPKKTYKIGEDIYDIEDSDVAAFLKQAPNAKEVKSFLVGKDTFDLELPDVDAFIKQVPDAKPLYEESLKKKEQAMPFDGQKFGGKKEEPLLPLTSSTVSPSASKPPKSTIPSASTGVKTKVENLSDFNKKYNTNYTPAQMQGKQPVEIQPEDESFASELFQSAQRGSSMLGSMLANTPSFIYNVAAYPQNKIAELTGLPIGTSSAQIAETLGLPENEIANYYEQVVKDGQAKIQQKYDKSVTEYLFGDNPDYKKGFKLLSNQVVESAPISLSMMMGNAAGIGAVGSTLGGGLVFGAGNMQDLEGANMFETAKVENALSKGLFEGIFEQFGVTKLGGVVSDIFKKQGAEAAANIAKEGFKDVYLPVLKKYVGIGAEESLGEAATQFSQNMVTILSGENPNLNPMEGVADAALVGLGSSVAYSTPTAAAETLALSKKRKEIRENQIKLQKIEEAVANPETTPETKVVLSNMANDINSSIADAYDESKNLYQNLSEEDRVELSQILTKKQELEIAAQDPNIDEEIKKEIGLQIENIDNKINEISDRSAVEPKTEEIKTDESGISQEAAPKGDTELEVTEPVIEEGKEQVEIEKTPIKEQETIAEASDSKGVYLKDGEYGVLRTDGQTVVFETNDKIFDLGNKDELSDVSIAEFGIEKEEPLNIQVNQDNSIVIDDVRFVNNFSEPQAAINTDADGNVISVNLETEDGKKRTFRGQRAEEIAYQYKLKEFEQNATEESIARLEQEVTSIEGKAEKAKSETKKRSVAKRKSETIKTKEDAVQKQTAGQVPVQPEAKAGEGVEGGKPKAEPKEATEEKQEEVANKAGISPKNFKDLYNVNRKLFGLDRVKSLASAVAMDRMIGAMAKRAGTTKAEMYGRLKFEKDIEANVLKADNALFQGMVDGKPVTLRNMDVDVVNGFYSPIEKNVKEYGKDKIKAKDWLNVVGKGDEAVFTGVRAFLEGKDPNAMVSKQEILDYMKDNRISVVEVVLKEGEGKTAKERFEVKIELEGEKENYKEVLVTLPSRGSLNDLRNFFNTKDRKGKDFDNLTRDEFVDLQDEYRKSKQFKSTHFDEPNILVHLRMNTRIDANGNKVLFLEEIQSDWGQEGKKRGFEKPENTQAIEELENEKQKVLDSSKSYQLLNNKTEGNLSVEVFDAIQQVATNMIDNNYSTEESRKEKFLKDIESTLNYWSIYNEVPKMTQKELSDFYDVYIKELENNSKKTTGYGASYRLASLENKIEDINEKIYDFSAKEGIPTAPFVMDTNAWTKLGLKVALKEAVAQGVDKIAWTTGEQQNDRYDLSKQVDYIDYWRNKNGTYGFSLPIEFTKPSELTAPELENYLGKEVAKKIVDNSEPKIITEETLLTKNVAEGYIEQGKDVYYEIDGVKMGKINSLKQIDDLIFEYRGRVEFVGEIKTKEYPKESKPNRLQGEDLKVGGKGMKGFYGSIEEGTKGIVGGVAEKVFGQKVEKVRMKGESKPVYKIEDRSEQGEPAFAVIDEATPSEVLTIPETRKEAEDWIKEQEKRWAEQFQEYSQPSIDITPALRAEVERGLALFQRQQGQQAKGAMVAADGAFVIYALTDPNVSTPLHELAHVFEHYLTDAEKNSVIKAAGTKEWNIQTSEFFARGFEKYLAEGKSPVPALDKLFAKFKEWLAEIYNGIKGSDIDIKLNKKMRDIYSQMLGVEISEGKSKKEQVDEVKVEKSKKAFEALLKEESASPTAKKKASELKKEAGDKAVKEAAEIMENIDSIRQQLLDAGVIKSINCKWG